MKPYRPFLRLGAAALALLLGACAGDAGSPLLLTLPPAAAALPAAATPEPAAGDAPTLAVRRLGLPEYVLARRVRYRADASTLAEWPNTVWAERIETGMDREFVAALRQALPGWTLCDNDCHERAPALAVQVNLAPLDFVRPEHRLLAQARIDVVSAGAGARVLKTQERGFEIAAGTDSPQAQAQALSDLLRALAPVVAETVRKTQP